MVRTGLDLLLHEELALLKGRRVGLVSHMAAVLPDLTVSLDALLAAGIQITALFGPEHGFAGFAADGAHVSNAVDPRTGLPVFSLYGDTREPSPEMMSEVDVLIFDMQDVGVRFYTYLSTLYFTLRGAARAGKQIIVLDRPNPIGGHVVEGPLLQPGYESFVGIVPLPVRHGMTFGEMAQFMNEEYKLSADLYVIRMQGWERKLWFDETGLPWTPTSPAMPQLSTATLYPGTCLLEGTNISEGRGTSLPFEQCGAPWIDAWGLARHLNELDLPGVRFRPTFFRPYASKFNNKDCAGVQIHVLDRRVTRPVSLGLHLIEALRKQAHEHFTWGPHFERLIGRGDVRPAIDQGGSISTLVDIWGNEELEFRERSAPYRLYQ